MSAAHVSKAAICCGSGVFALRALSPPVPVAPPWDILMSPLTEL